MPKTYPVSLLLENKRAVVIGGGSVATRKVKGLLECEALVHVVSPKATDELKELIDGSHCIWSAKTYETTDLACADIVFASTDDEAVNAQVFHDATEARLMVNVADRPELCSFFLPSVLRRGRLSVSVSTQGSSPLLARRLRESLEGHIDDCFTDYLELLHVYRTPVNETLPEEKRVMFWEQAIDGRVFACVQHGEMVSAQTLLDTIFSELHGSLRNECTP